MIPVVDDFLNKTTMYRVVLYVLIALISVAFILSFFGVLSYSPLSIATSAVLFLLGCWITNKIFAFIFEAPSNPESSLITALILTLIISPIQSIHGIVFISWAAILAIASKYILAINKKHIFNPAAIAVVLTAFGINQSASWWVGTAAMLPAVLIGGFLIVRKIRRFDLVFYFFLISLSVVLATSLMQGTDLLTTFNQVLLHSSLFFFAFVMLTEPLTTPPTKNLQITYGALVGFLFAPEIHLGQIYSTPELALVIGNVFSFLVSPKQKLILKLKDRFQLSQTIFDFVFTPNKQLSFLPGQYMEWTLAHESTDSRGSRRYFTIASSPTEDTLRIGLKFNEHGSSFKKALLRLDQDTAVVAAQIAGDFTLPTDPKQKLVFIAGGIGVTPFRSMIKYLIDKNEKRDIVLFYSARTPSEIVYKDIFNQGQNQLGIKVIYTVTDKLTNPSTWSGRVGPVTPELIKQEVPDFKERLFYLSGPQSMILAFEKTLQEMGIPGDYIKKDFFPGFA